MNRELADRAEIGADDHVLDCGCGVGGSSVWLAAERDATVTGVDLVPLQLREARELAAERGVADRAAFARGDFTDLPLPADSVDVVWGHRGGSLGQSASPVVGPRRERGRPA